MRACFEDGDRIAPLGYRVVGDPAGACNRARSGLARLRAAALGIVPQALAVALERGLKARVADVVGLELCLRREGEPIDPLALHLSDHAESDDAAQAGDETAVDDV